MLRSVTLFCPRTKMSKIYKGWIVFIAQTLPLLYRYLNWKRPEIQIIVTTCGDVWIRKHLRSLYVMSHCYNKQRSHKQADMCSFCHHVSAPTGGGGFCCSVILSVCVCVRVCKQPCVVGLELVVCFVHALHVFSIPAQMCGAYLAFILSSTVRVTCFFLCSFSLFCHSAMCIRNLSTMCLPMGHKRN